MHTTEDSPLTEIILIAVFLGLAVLFLLTQYSTLKLIRPANRRMQPGWIWLQLIPFLGLIWGFFVVIAIAGSARNQRMNTNDDSILGMSPADAAEIGKRRTLISGLIWSSLWLIEVPTMFMSRDDSTTSYHAVFSLAQITCWIIYWVQLFRLRQSLRRPGL